jgi:hypothetical protein
MLKDTANKYFTKPNNVKVRSKWETILNKVITSLSLRLRNYNNEQNRLIDATW